MFFKRRSAEDTSIVKAEVEQPACIISNHVFLSLYTAYDLSSLSYRIFSSPIALFFTQLFPDFI